MLLQLQTLAPDVPQELYISVRTNLGMKLLLNDELASQASGLKVLIIIQLISFIIKPAETSRDLWTTCCFRQSADI